ncbi:triose-phosphate isomerase [Candidatus Marinamargulisbacteria bacterium SCGC AG-439-L15]|nr:triose-phosphate isomerase [Candidatus Marinamargulisbacteria bacterium SCGC AG-439-L15]
MRRRLVAGNWKMNKTVQESESLIQSLCDDIASVNDVEVLVCPPFVSLMKASELLKSTSFKLGAQTVHQELSGAFTGEISAPMLRSVGCDYVIIGHSERRQYFGETDALVNQKLFLAFDHDITPIVCIGETLEQREGDQTLAVITQQLTKGLASVSSTQQIVIAYEPVWAIGTGKVATPEQAQEVHAFIRQQLSTMMGAAYSDQTRLLYGGSVKPDNASELILQKDIDGFLVGGASLKSSDFSQIIQLS